MVGFVPTHLLRRHVSDSAHHRARIGNLFPSIDFRTDTLTAQWPQLRQTKIENLHAAVSRDEEIFRLQITMSDPSFMRRCQTLSDLLGVVERFALGKRAIVELLAQLFTLKQF